LHRVARRRGNHGGRAGQVGRRRLHERRERGLAADERLQLVQQVEALLVPGGSERRRALQQVATRRSKSQHGAASRNMLRQSAARGGGG
jgi:hypothetical protein